jgi:hypothetical protein
MNKKRIELLEDILKYLRLHNRVLHDRLSDMLIEIYDEKKKLNDYKSKHIAEKRKTNKEYAGHGKKSKENDI